MVGGEGKGKLPAGCLAGGTPALAAQFVGQNLKVLRLSSQISSLTLCHTSRVNLIAVIIALNLLFGQK